MKAFLKGGEGMMFPLSPKVTTVGRDGCDLNIQVFDVDIIILQPIVTTRVQYLSYC